MPDHKSARASADRAQEAVGHKVTYSDGGLMDGVPAKAPEIDENRWINENARNEKIVSPRSNDRMPIYKSDIE